MVDENKGKEKREILINNKYYDVTSFIKKHPGGSIIKFIQANEDATTAFNQFHIRSSKAQKMLDLLPSRDAKKDELSNLDKNPKSGELIKDFAKLQKKLVDEGYFKPSYLHIAYRIFEIFMMHIIGFMLLFNNHTIIGLIILGIAQGRCGWLMHEGGHYSMTSNIKIDRHLQMFFYGLGCGMSGCYWRNQHNKHHCTPQKLKHDVDLNTLPFVAFNKAIVPRSGPTLWLKFQDYLFPTLSTLLIATGWQAFLHPRHSLRVKNWTELFWMGLRVLLIALFIVPTFGIGQTFMYYMFYNWIGGTYIFTNFALSHTHKPVSQAKDIIDWVYYSADYTVNISNNWMVNWWMGYLNFQIEHHLFPSLPQFRHPKVSILVKQLFKKHNVPYDYQDYPTAVKLTFKNLHDVGHLM